MIIPGVLLLQGEVGGGEGVEGTYGSITQAGMQHIVHVLQQRTGLGMASVFLDVGCGLGR